MCACVSARGSLWRGGGTRANVVQMCPPFSVVKIRLLHRVRPALRCAVLRFLGRSITIHTQQSTDLACSGAIRIHRFRPHRLTDQEKLW